MGQPGFKKEGRCVGSEHKTPAASQREVSYLRPASLPGDARSQRCKPGAWSGALKAADGHALDLTHFWSAEHPIAASMLWRLRPGILPTSSASLRLVRHRHAAVERPPAALCAIVAGYALSTTRLPRTREDCVVCEASIAFGHLVAVGSCLDGKQADGDFGHLRVLIRRPAAEPILPSALSLVLADRIEKSIVYLVYRRLSA